ncbi:hypothetical protein NE237_020832 [Protea cynaroides]|uniref:UPF0261 domain-containing protein n=1 Tax=Protea cynaroides TaxID=273540 RepID=A0A9Q0H6V1_9MAGN|nr:hypothetical protein NE237_020832 [Protea cynaroides]
MGEDTHGRIRLHGLDVSPRDLGISKVNYDVMQLDLKAKLTYMEEKMKERDETMASLQSQVMDRDVIMERLQSKVEKLTQFVILNQTSESSVNLDENQKFAAFIVDEVNKMLSKICICLPQNGISALDAPGQFSYDPETTGALIAELERLVVLLY